MKLIIDRDEKLGYETNSIAKSLLNIILIPILNAVPARSRHILRKTHKSASDIIDHATTHKALEILYGHSSAKTSGTIIQNIFRKIWLSTNNSRAVRNRLRLVKREVGNKLLDLACVWFLEGNN